MDLTLWNLCQRDQLLALRDQARRQQAAGNAQAAHVVSWMDRILTNRNGLIVTPGDRRNGINRASATPIPHHCHHHALAQKQTQ